MNRMNLNVGHFWDQFLKEDIIFLVHTLTTHPWMKIETWLLEGDDKARSLLTVKMEESGEPLKKD